MGVNIRYDSKRAAKGHRPWGVYIEVTIGGKRRRPSLFYQTEAEAIAGKAEADLAVERWWQDYEATQPKQEPLPPLPSAPAGVRLFETVAHAWLQLHVTKHCEAATVRSYHHLLDRHLLPTLRAWAVTDEGMDPVRLDGFFADLFQRGVPLPTRRHAHACLSSCLAWAKAKGYGRLSHNPALGLGRFLRQPSEKKIKTRPPNPMNPVQAEAFLSWIHDHHREWWEYFLWLIDEGSRVGEASALKWTNVFLDTGKAYIVESFSPSQRLLERQRGEEGLGEKDTKTHRENQYIDLSPRVVIALRELQAAQRKESFRCGRRVPQHVFTTRSGSPRKPDGQMREVFTDAVAGSKLLELTNESSGSMLTPHCLRDTFATLNILRGRHPGWVAMMLGHETEDTMRRRYYKWIRMIEINPFVQGGESQAGPS